MKKIISKLKPIVKSKYFPYILIFIFSLLLILPSLFGEYHLGDDQYFHMSNIKVISDNLPFSIFSKIFPEMANDFGFGVGIFYPPLPHIVGAITYSIVSLFGIGLVLNETIIHFLIFLASGITMYLLAKEVFKDNKKGIIASLFYITYNYVFVDVIIRDALNEAFTFIFMPLIFLGLYSLFNNHNLKKFYLCFVLGYTGMMYSHLVMSVWFTIFLIIFLLFYLKDIFKKENFGHLCLAALLILIFTSTFTVPMLEHKFSDVTYVSFIERNWSLEDVWSMPFNGFYEYVGYQTGFDINPGVIYTNFNFIVIIFFVIALFKIFNKKTDKNLKKFLLGLVIFGVLAIILCANKSIWLHIPSLLLSIQFPWRLAGFAGFAITFVATYALDSYLNIFKTKFISLAMLIIIVFLGYFVVSNNDNTKFVTYIEEPNISKGGAVREHFPLKVYENEEDFWNKDYKISVIDGKGKVKIIEDNTPYMKFKVTDIDKKVTLELPRLYYLGYEITDNKGNVYDYDCHNPGYISVKLTKNGVYELNYVGTTAYHIAFIVKMLTIISVIVFITIYSRKNKK